MTPNLFLATQRVFTPHKWFKSLKQERSVRETEFWADGPVPGLYEFVPGRGNYLIATLQNTSATIEDSKFSNVDSLVSISPAISQNYTPLERPVRVVYVRALRKWFLEPDYQLRKKTATIKNAHGKSTRVSFFRTDDHGGVAWVQCWDESGNFIPGPYQKWCVDGETGAFRHMRHRDDPDFIREQILHEHDSEVRSQDSMSTAFRSRPGSARMGDSGPSTRAGSVAIASNPASSAPSQRPSRDTSPVRSSSIALDEAKAKLRMMAFEQQEAGNRGRKLIK